MEFVSLRLLLLWHRATEVWSDPEGFSTAELLGNAALAIGALVAIWAFLRIVGIDLLKDIQNAVEKTLQ